MSYTAKVYWDTVRDIEFAEDDDQGRQHTKFATLAEAVAFKQGVEEGGQVCGAEHEVELCNADDQPIDDQGNVLPAESVTVADEDTEDDEDEG